MAVTIKRLNDRQVKTINRPGRHADGAGLYLVVDKSQARRWVFMSWRGRRQREIGLGGYPVTSLAKARELADCCRQCVQEGKDPREVLGKNKAVPTFGAFADDYIAKMESSWRNAKHRQQWRNSLNTYAAVIWDRPIDAVITDDLLAILTPIWTAKAETASRVRGRIEKVLDAAKAKGYRSGPNPAAWTGHLKLLLPQRQKLQRGHHKALPWKQLPEFMEKLREQTSTAALACEFLILTASRTGEILQSKRDGAIHAMRWSEVSLDGKLWIVPAVRMKAGKEHRVPLSGRAVEILEQLASARQSDYVFPSPRPGKPLSEGSIVALLKRMAVSDATPHGFRSSFRDWAGDKGYQREIAEAALAHTVGDAVERAYRRGDALELRRQMMEAWATFLAQQEA